MEFDPIDVILIEVGGRCIRDKFVVLLLAALFFNVNPSNPDILAVEGRLVWAELRDNDRAWVADVGVLIKLLILLTRAWLSAVESRGTLDFRSARDLG